jgi:gluconolactonase
MTIEVKSPRMLELVAEDATVEQLGTGFMFTEGPVWHPKEQCLYFSDIPADTRRRWSAADGSTEVNKPNNKGNGMTYDGALNLYICEHVTSAMVRETPSGERQVLATHWKGKELNSPNDVVVKSDGAVYFSDPSYGRLPVFGLEREQDLDFQAIFRISPSGELNCEVDDFDQPNGLCFSPDESLLYVNDTTRAHIRVFDVGANGGLTNGRIFAENIGTGQLEKGVVDGMKCDERGNVYVTGPGGFWVFGTDGEHLGNIRVAENAANLNWGGTGWNELYCTCSTSLYRITLKVAGNRLAYM